MSVICRLKRVMLHMVLEAFKTKAICICTMKYEPLTLQTRADRDKVMATLIYHETCYLDSDDPPWGCAAAKVDIRYMNRRHPSFWSGAQEQQTKQSIGLQRLLTRGVLSPSWVS